ncbi:hypothetical protein EV363DRAFT_1257019 [Boletus edulis]|uniref:Uncharacterized protein n=1 Tax=Boletus edulis BED1 TaxID=1328754 RepID=A0AAD4GGH6_BOLED|nr:hypothetical protein EV363DRAFT_1257019 [Boletus edulis]KAF8442343.1 hypothetical protein L210DRAFT_3644463 [Boletus edulis BED1]
MARGKPAKTLLLKVPRHGAQRIGYKFSLSVENLVRKEYPVKSPKQRPRVRHQHNNDPPTGALAQSIEAASEWNSLLIGARAHRGPQWDMGTQQFQVDYGSTLYYDPTPLLEVLKQQRPQEEDHLQTPVRPGSMQPPDFRHESPRIVRNPSASAVQPNYAYGSPRHPQQPHQQPAFNVIPASHFYGDPRAAGGMGSMSPDIWRRAGRVGPDEGFITLHAHGQ